ncbi:MAG: hypothetical protein ACI4JW_10465 [Oscillospiraceae bacterium]
MLNKKNQIISNESVSNNVIPTMSVRVYIPKAVENNDFDFHIDPVFHRSEGCLDNMLYNGGLVFIKENGKVRLMPQPTAKMIFDLTVLSLCSGEDEEFDHI